MLYHMVENIQVVHHAIPELITDNMRGERLFLHIRTCKPTERSLLINYRQL